MKVYIGGRYFKDMFLTEMSYTNEGLTDSNFAPRLCMLSLSILIEDVTTCGENCLFSHGHRIKICYENRSKDSVVLFSCDKFKPTVDLII